MNDDHEKQPIQDMSLPESLASPTTKTLNPKGEEGLISARSEIQQDSSKFIWPELCKEWHVPPLKHYWEKERKNHFTNEDKKRAWNNVTEAVKTYTDEMIKRWTEEMDTLLVYAGLFSAILTAFNVQSYALLTPAAPDPILDALQRISEQLSSFSLNPTFVNSTAPAWHQSSSPAQSAPPGWAVWLNILWFSSLILSLSSVSMALMVKQKLNDYSDGISGNSRQAARLRQYRLNGMVRWRMGSIISFLPKLLIISLQLFLAGLLVLLYNLHLQVAIAASVLVGILGSTLMAAVSLSSIATDCAFPTPLSSSEIYLYVYRTLVVPSYTFLTFLQLLTTWFPQDTYQHSHWVQGVTYVTETIERFVTMAPSFEAMEKAQVQQRSMELDANILSMAYITTMDLGQLENSTVCFSDLNEVFISRIFHRIDAENQEHRSADTGAHWTLNMPRGMAYDVLLAKYQSSSERPDLSALQPYLDSFGTVDSLDSKQWNHFLSNCAIIVRYYRSQLEPAFWRGLSHTLYSEVSRLDGSEAKGMSEEYDLQSVAALAYKTLQACEESQDQLVLSHYIKSLYVLATCTQAVDTLGVNGDNYTAQDLHNGLKAAQSKFSKLIQVHKSNEQSILGLIQDTKLEFVGGISDEMLDAMVDYANSDNSGTYEGDKEREWVRDLKRKRDQAKQETAPMPLRTDIHSAVVPVTVTSGDLSAGPALIHAPESGTVVAIPSTSCLDNERDNIAAITESPREIPVPVSHEHLPVQTLSTGPTASSHMGPGPRATLNRTDAPAVELINSASGVRGKPREAEELPRTTADVCLAIEPSQRPLDTGPVVGTVPESADPRAESSVDPCSADLPRAEFPSANLLCADFPSADFPSADVLSAECPRADRGALSAESRRADEDPRAEEDPGADEDPKADENCRSARDCGPQASDEIERGPLALDSAVAETIDEEPEQDAGTGSQLTRLYGWLWLI